MNFSGDLGKLIKGWRKKTAMSVNQKIWIYNEIQRKKYIYYKHMEHQKHLKQKQKVIDDFNIENFKNEHFRKISNSIKIDLAVPIFYGKSKLKRDLLILFFKYLRHISDVLGEINIHLSFTIVGSDKQDSLDLFNTYLKKNILDTYIEFDQKNIDYKTLPKSYINYTNPIFNMLHLKFSSCFKNSWEKDVDIYCISGSNDFIDINFYINIAHKYDSNKSQIYGLNKRRNVTLITSSSAIKKLNIDNTLFWNLDYGDRNYFKDVCFSGGVMGMSRSPFWKKPESKKYLFDCLFKSMLAFNEVEMEKIFINNGDCNVETIDGCFSINYKTGDDLTSLQMIKDTIISDNFFDVTSKNIIFTKCNKFWNKILAL